MRIDAANAFLTVSAVLLLWSVALVVFRRRLFAPGRRSFRVLVFASLGIGGGLAARVLLDAHGAAIQLWGEAIDLFEAGAIVTLALGLLLSIWSYRGDRPRGRLRCPKCWYDMTGLALVCPECGHDAKREKDLFRPRRRRRGIFAGLILLLASYGLWLAPEVRKHGPSGVIPTWALITGLPWLPNSYIDASFRMRTNNWSLGDRIFDQHLTRLDRWYLRIRTERLVRSSPDLSVLQRVLWIDRIRGRDSLSYSKPEYATAICLSVGRALCSSNNQERSAAAALYAECFGMAVTPQPQAGLRPLLRGLLIDLDDPDPQVRNCAAVLVTNLCPEADAAVPKILAMLSDPVRDPTYLRCALRTAAQNSPNATNMILDASRARDEYVRRGCAYALGSFAASARGGTDRLVEMLKDPEHGVQYLAAVSLVDATVRPSDVIPRVLNWAQTWSLADSSPIDGLSRFMPRDLAPFAPELVALLGHPSSDVRKAAANRLRELIQNPEVDLSGAVKPLTQMIQDPLSVGSRTASDLLAELHRARR